MPNINDYGLPFTSEDGDRKYSALDWREYFSRLIHNGLIQNAANECQVKPQAAPNKTVYVDTGVVFINGAMRILEEPVTLIIAENTSGNPRIDRVVARLNEASRTIEFAVLEGTPAGSPVAPALTRAEGVYELGLADITLANGYSTISTAEITDQRWDVSLCGASSMTIGVIPPSGLEAETVTVSAELANLYGLTPGVNANVDIAFSELVNTILPRDFYKNNGVSTNANGYMILGNLILEWMYYPSASSGGVIGVTLPITIPANGSVLYVGSSTMGTDSGTAYVSSFTKSAVTIAKVSKNAFIFVIGWLGV